jgi:hypothetical protein
MNYRVHMTIRGSMTKPSYSGHVDVVADTYDEAVQSAISKCQRTAHWDSPRDDFKVDEVEVNP